MRQLPALQRYKEKQMKTVFIDLEFCEIPKQNKEMRKTSKFEIIEVGAVKLDDQNRVIDRFDTFVKPQYGEITTFITELTHIRPEDVNGAREFGEVMDSFVEWLGEEDTLMYSWSSADWMQIQRECRMKSYENDRLESLYEEWVDFQMVFGKIIGIEQPISLENALNGAGIVFEGRPHSAIADAENTAALYALTQNKEAFEESAKQILEIMRPKPALSFSLGNLIPAEMLEKMEM